MSDIYDDPDRPRKPLPDPRARPNNTLGWVLGAAVALAIIGLLTLNVGDKRDQHASNAPAPTSQTDQSSPARR